MSSLIAGRSTRMEILELLRRRQAASAEEISGEMGITPNAVRQHLTNLERDGYVRSEPVRHKRGRPSLLFSLTDRADAVFPKRYGQLATMVLTELQEMGGPEVLDEVFRRVALRHATAVEPDLDGLDFDQKLERVVTWIARAGTLADHEDLEDGTVRVSVDRSRLKDAAAGEAEALERTGVTIEDSPRLDGAQLVLDALLGTGLSRAPEGRYADWIRRANDSGMRVIAADVPSGLEADSGHAYDPCISAHITVTLGLPKAGLLRGDGPERAGELWVADIGIPSQAYAAIGVQVPAHAFAMDDRIQLGALQP